MREAIGARLLPPDRGAYAQAIRVASQMATQEAFQSAWAAGRALPPEHVVANALALEPDELTPPTAPGRASAGSHPRRALTRREREITLLLARGLTNRQLAERLVISEKTVETHVHNVLRKLGLTSRQEIESQPY